MYGIAVTNNGPCSDFALLFDNLPNNVDFVSASSGCTASGQTVTCVTPSLPAGGSVNISITVEANAVGPAFNSARVIPGTNSDPIPNNNTGALTVITPEESPSNPPPTFCEGEDCGGGNPTDFGFPGGFGNFGGGFSAATTPVGGVDTGAGGTARSSAAVPQVALSSLLAMGFALAVLRRFRRRAA